MTRILITGAVILALLGQLSSANEEGIVAKLEHYLRETSAERRPIDTQDFARLPLTRNEAAQIRDRLWTDYRRRIRTERAAEMNDRVLRHGEHKLRFSYRVLGDPPADGRSLFISMHGGGGAPARVNDRQWENQKNLYTPDEGVYLTPRAPTNEWNLWHQTHIDPLFDRLISNLVVFENVNPNRVYLMGYSAGGDGVYQLAPRMADRWAAAAMMAGHPNEASPLGLRISALLCTWAVTIVPIAETKSRPSGK